MIETVSSHQFKYSPFEEDILIVGGKGKRKTTKGKELLSTIPNIPYWVWDYSNQFQGFGNLVHSVDQLQYGQFILQASDKSKENYGKFLNKAFHMADSIPNLVVVTDELHQITNKNEIFQPLYHFVLSGRNKGLSSIFITTRTHSVPNYILSNVSHLFAFSLALKTDIEWLRDYIGEKAWLLIPKDKRNNYFLAPEDPDVLPIGSYIYRNMSENDSSVVIPE